MRRENSVFIQFIFLLCPLDLEQSSKLYTISLILETLICGVQDVCGCGLNKDDEQGRPSDMRNSQPHGGALIATHIISME